MRVADGLYFVDLGRAVRQSVVAHFFLYVYYVTYVLVGDVASSHAPFHLVGVSSHSNRY